MNVEQARDYSLTKPAATEDTPFGPDVIVFRVGSKIFALINIERMPFSINLKCDPERAIELREEHEDVLPGYHMNKKHWNTVVLNGSLAAAEVGEMIDHSYSLVFASLSKKGREALP